MNRMMLSSPVAEPMSLGSPTQSPSQIINQQYLPQFLLGDLPSSSSSSLNNQRNQQHNQNQNSKYWTGSSLSSSSSSPPRALYNNNQQSMLLLQQQQQQQQQASAGFNPMNSLTKSYSINSYDKLNSSNTIDNNNKTDLYAHNQQLAPYHQQQLLQQQQQQQQQMGYGGGYGGGYGSSSSSSSISSASNQAASQQQQQIPGAPPINRLVDIINKPSLISSPSSSINYQTATPTTTTASLNTTNNKTSADFYANNNLINDKLIGDLSFVTTPNANIINSINSISNRSPPSPTQIDPFYAFGESIQLNDRRLDDTWITVFGFPPSATSYVLQEFSIYGQIIRHLPSSQGNWLHIQYQTRLQAQKALSKNGKVLANSLMVGVMQCIDKKVMNYGGNNSGGASASTNTTTTTSIIDTSTLLSELGGGLSALSPTNTPSSSSSSSNINTNKVATRLGPSNKLDRTQSLRTTGVRPLGPFNRNSNNLPADSDHHVNSTAQLPKKNVNVISKAMEFMFGW